MTRPKTEAWFRLGTGIVLNVILWPLIQALARWTNFDREVRLTLISAAIGTAALIMVVPLFWRGRPWQAPIAFVLLWLPALALYDAFSLAVR